jgi:hypothetical protein
MVGKEEEESMGKGNGGGSSLGVFRLLLGTMALPGDFTLSTP